jgi:hypothetical protein
MGNIENCDHSPCWESFEVSTNNNNITREVRITVALKFENCNINVTGEKKISSCPIFFCDPLEDKIVHTGQVT